MRYKYFNPNPAGRAVGDCAVRAISAALGVDWEEAYAMIAAAGYAMNDMPSSDSVWGSVLRMHNFYKTQLPCCYTFAEFAEDHPRGVYVLGTGTHVATIIDGVLLDAWNSLNEVADFVWFRKD